MDLDLIKDRRYSQNRSFPFLKRVVVVVVKVVVVLVVVLLLRALKHPRNSCFSSHFWLTAPNYLHSHLPSHFATVLSEKKKSKNEKDSKRRVIHTHKNTHTERE